MSFREAFERTLLTLATTRELLSIAIVSVLFYAFYYPAPYQHQQTSNLPLVVVDRDQSALSRTLLRELGATRSVSLVGEAPDMVAARQAVRDRRAEGILLLSHGLAGDVLAGRPGAGIGLWVNGTYLLRAEGIATSLIEVVSDEARALARRIDPGKRDGAEPVHVQPLFNTTLGYRDYIFPSVANIILQQTLLFAAARLVAERRRAGRWRSGPSAALGTWVACMLVGVLAALFYFGFVYWLQDVPRLGNPAGLAIAVPLFAAAVSALGLFIGSLCRSGDDALKLLIPTSVPLVFLGGFAWPLDQMPDWLATIAWASPATCAMHIFIRFNQMGATLAEVAGPLLTLAGLAIVYGAAMLVRTVSRSGEGPPAAPR